MRDATQPLMYYCIRCLPKDRLWRRTAICNDDGAITATFVFPPREVHEMWLQHISAAIASASKNHVLESNQNIANRMLALTRLWRIDLFILSAGGFYNAKNTIARVFKFAVAIKHSPLLVSNVTKRNKKSNRWLQQLQQQREREQRKGKQQQRQQ